MADEARVIQFAWINQMIINGLLIDDCNYWIEHGTYKSDEIATRFHHRLVWIHPYPNGNGRRARLATDLLLGTRGFESFSWGSATGCRPA